MNRNVRQAIGVIVIILILIGTFFWWRSQDVTEGVRIPNIYQDELNKSLGDPVVIPDVYVEELREKNDPGDVEGTN